MDIYTIKQKAKEISGGHWGNIIILFIIAILLNILGNYLDDAIFKDKINLIANIINIFIEFGIVVFFINIVRTGKSNWQDIFEAFKKNPWTIFLIGLLRDIFIFLWTLLLIIPGIMKAYSYAMAWYIYNDNPNMGPMETLRTSEQMMKGHRWELFKLQFSFWPWILLGIITFGLAWIYIYPWLSSSIVLFYEELKGTEEIGEQVDNNNTEEN